MCISVSPVLGIDTIGKNLTQQLLDYRTKNADHARIAAHALIRKWQGAQGEAAEAELHDDMQAANLRLKLAVDEVRKFLTDLRDIPLPKRLAYAQNRFNSAQGWFTQNEAALIQDGFLVDEIAANRVNLCLSADERLGWAKQYEDMKNTDRYNISNIEESYRVRVIEAEKSVHEYVRFQEELKRLSEANSEPATS